MKTDVLINGHITLVLTPENIMEEEILKALLKQQSEIIELRSAVHVLGKTLRNGLIIQKQGSRLADKENKDSAQSESNETDEDKT